VSPDAVVEPNDAAGQPCAAINDISSGRVSDPLYSRVREFKYGMNAHGIVCKVYGQSTHDFHDQLILTAVYRSTAFTAVEADSMARVSYQHVVGNSQTHLTVDRLRQVQSSIDGQLTLGQKFSRLVLSLHAIQCPSYGT
jgi:hypothetical protein